MENNHHLRATISIEHQISTDEPSERVQHIRHKLERQIQYFCEPWGIRYKISEFWHYPDECAESCGQKFLGTSIVLTCDLTKSQSYYYLANYIRSVFDLLKQYIPDFWMNADFELS